MQVYPVTCMIRRLSDGYVQIYSNNDLKKYEPLDAEFSNLPIAVLDIIKGGAKSIDAMQSYVLLKNDPLDIPNGEILTGVADVEDPPQPEMINESAVHSGVRFADSGLVEDSGSANSSPPVDLQPQVPAAGNASATHVPNNSSNNKPGTNNSTHKQPASRNVNVGSDESSDEENDPGMKLRDGKTVSFG